MFIDSDINLVLFDVFEDEVGNFYGVGYSSEPESNYRKGLLIKFDPYGEIIESKNYPLQAEAYTIFNILQDSLGSLILCGYLTDTTPDRFHCKIKMQRLDYSLETLNENTIPISDDHTINVINPCIGFGSNLLITAGIFKNTPPYGLFYNLRMNSNFDSIYASIQLAGLAGTAIRQITDSTYWIVAGPSPFYIQLDTLFNLIEYFEIPGGISDPLGIKWDTDTSFFIAGEWVPGSSHEIGILRQHHPFEDSNQRLITWRIPDTIDMTALNGALDFQNKDSIFVGGTAPFHYPWGNSPSFYSLIQTDSLLNIRWERFYGGEDYYYELYRVIATNDGGCLLAGIRFDYTTGIKERDLYIIKLNNEGLIVGTSPKNELQLKEVIIFPNPGINNLKVRIAAQYPESTFELFKINGQLLLSEQLNGKWGDINTSFLKVGTYIYRIHNNDGLFETGKWVKQ